MPIDLSTLSDEELGLTGPGAAAPGMGAEGVQPIGPAELPNNGPGATFSQRLAASFKESPQGVVNYYKSVLGESAVRVNPEGNVEILDPQSGQWGPANPAGLDWGDLAELLSSAPEVIGGGLGALAGGTAGSIVPGAGTAAGVVAGGAAGTAAGNVVKQAIGALIPGEDPATLGERATDVGISALAGGAGGAIGPAARAAGRVITGGAAGAARQAEAAAIEAGIPGLRFGAGDATGGPLKGLQDTVARSMAGQRQAQSLLEANVRAVDTKMQNLVDQMTGNPATDAEIGNSLKNLLLKSEENLRKARQTDAGTRFALVDTEVGNTPTIDPLKFREVLNSMVREGTYSNGEKTARALGAEEVLKKMPRRMTARDMGTALEDWGSIGYGTGSTELLPNLGINERTGIARRLFKSLNDDLDRTIVERANISYKTGLPGPEKALREARDAYKMHMDAARKLRGSALAKIVGRATDADLPAIPDRILSRLKKPEQIRQLMSQVQGVNPAVHEQIQQHALAQALEAARAAAQTTAGGAGDYALRSATLAKTLEKPNFKALFWDQPNLARDLDLVHKGITRLAQNSAAGSPTAFNIERMLSAGMALNPAMWVKLGMYHGANWGIAKIMFNPELRAAAVKLANARAFSPEYRTAAAVLMANAAQSDE